MASRDLTLAVAGLGEAGMTLHLPALRGISGVRVVAACDRDEATRGRAADAWSIPVFDDYSTMIGKARPDVVIVATPPDTHRDFVLEALRSGAHVVCEKPFVSSLAEADEIVGATEATSRQVALNHEFGEMPIFRSVRDEVTSGRSGRLRFVQMWQLMNRPPWAEGGWRGRLVRRTLFEAGVHLVDYALSLFGEMPVTVQARTSACGGSEEEVDAVVLVVLEFSDGRLAHIVQDRVSPGEIQYFEVRADLERASVRASFGGRARVSAGLLRSTRPHLRVELGASGTAWKEVGPRRSFLARNPSNPNLVATRRVLERSLEAFRSGARPPIDAEAGRRMIEVIAGCYHSADTGRRVRLDAPGRAELLGLEMGRVRESPKGS